jgi:hypothetical protein
MNLAMLEQYLKMSHYNPVRIRDSSEVIPYSQYLFHQGILTSEEQSKFKYEYEQSVVSRYGLSEKALSWFSILRSRGMGSIDLSKYQLQDILEYRRAAVEYVDWSNSYKSTVDRPVLVNYLKNLSSLLLTSIKEGQETQWEYFNKLKVTTMRSYYAGLVRLQTLGTIVEVLALMAAKEQQLLESIPPLIIPTASTVGASNSFSKKLEVSLVGIAKKLILTRFKDITEHLEMCKEVESALESKGIDSNHLEYFRSCIRRNGPDLYKKSADKFSPLLARMQSVRKGEEGPEYSYSIEEVMGTRIICNELRNSLTDGMLARFLVDDIFLNNRDFNKLQEHLGSLLSVGLIDIEKFEELIRKGREDHGIQ